MTTTFPNNVTATPIGFPGQLAGARKPGSSKGYIIQDYLDSNPITRGVVIGNFAYQPTDAENYCVGINPGALAANIVGGTDVALDTAIVAYVTPTLSITLDGIALTVSPSPALAPGDDYAAIAAKLQTGLRTALVGTPYAATATVTYTGTIPNARYTLSLVTAQASELTLATTELATGLGLTQETGAILTQGTNGYSLLGVVIREGSYVTTDMGNLMYNVGFDNSISVGQNAGILQRGSIYVNLAGLLIGSSAQQYSIVYSRDTDGAVFLGSPTSTTFAGYTKSNFVTTSITPSNTVNNIIRIANDEQVGV